MILGETLRRENNNADFFRLLAALAVMWATLTESLLERAYKNLSQYCWASITADLSQSNSFLS